MKIENINKILPSNFTITNYSESRKQLYVNQKFRENIVAKYIFDIDYENQDINLNEFQEKYLAKDYFNSEGNLQWNYYLIFLRDSISVKIKKEIEKDETYARKFVFTLDELQRYLSYEKAISAAEENIVEKWKAQLTEADLQEVFSNENYVDAIPRYLNDNTKELKQLQPIDSRPDETQDFILDEVSSLSLNNDYRDFPVKRNFRFGKVNLITGPNGVGKTSLMEAIELLITGNNVRNENNFPESGAIKAKYEVNLDELEDSYNNSIPKFKARNYYWYNTRYNQRGSNTLHHSFNRYNFYNSDSAYHLSNNTNGSDLIAYLSAIALGTEFGAIRERIIKFKDRFSKQLNNFNDDCNREIEIKKNALTQKEKLKQISNPDKVFQEYLAEAKQLKWIGFIPKTINDKPEKFEQDYRNAFSLLNSIVHSSVAKESDVSKKIGRLETLKLDLQSLTFKKKELTKSISGYHKNIENNEANVKLIDNALVYLMNPKSFRIETVDEDFKLLEKKISKIEMFLKEIEDLDISRIITSDLTLQEFSESKKNILAIKTSELKRSKEQLKILKSTLDKINALIVDIKYYGKEYIEAKEHLDACPLCETPHTKSELIAKVQTEYEDKEGVKNIETFNKNIRELEDEISKIQLELNQSKKYEELLNSYYTEDQLKVKISELQPLIDIEKSQFNSLKKELNKLTTLILELKLEGFDLENFLKLKTEISSKYPILEFKATNKIAFETQKSDTQRIIDSDKEEIKVIKEEISKLDLKVNELLGDNFSRDRYNEEIEFQTKEYQSYLEYFKKLKNYINFKEDDFIIEMRHSLERLNKTFSIFKEQKIKFEELTLANKLIKSAESKIEKILPKIERAKSALKVLNKIIVEDSEEKVLDSFFKKNENEISEIFTSIHSPKEFSKLSINSGNIVLHKKNTNAIVPISQISTGQRSALALSIFLALNKKLSKGPNLIIFDDPVTYTDDLNILSFLDYLRSIVINESRQVIFATASNKIAKLFEKKFSFLNTDFKKFELSRSEN
ncbi:hypothetical protein ABMY20_01215 [Tenacibaculum sp. SSH1-16]|uniref:hypothetical protein n=1 Tax=Tenacibaculum sp. SSH1-16 TaxID=3136667 RepID=UPI0032C43ED9